MRYRCRESTVVALDLGHRSTHRGRAQAQAPAALAQLPEESRRALWRSDPEYVSAALDSVNREYGSIDGYVERALGLSKSEIRALRFLQMIEHGVQIVGVCAHERLPQDDS